MPLRLSLCFKQDKLQKEPSILRLKALNMLNGQCCVNACTAKYMHRLSYTLQITVLLKFPLDVRALRLNWNDLILEFV